MIFLLNLIVNTVLIQLCIHRDTYNWFFVVINSFKVYGQYLPILMCVSVEYQFTSQLISTANNLVW